MVARDTGLVVLIVVFAVSAAACAGARPDLVQAAAPAAAAELAPTPSSAPTPTPLPTPTPTPTPTPAPTPTPPPPPTPTPRPTATPPPTATPTPTPTPIALVVHEQQYVLMGAADGVNLYHPADRVQFIGLHESGHDGARPITLASSGTQSRTLPTRWRDTSPSGAADVVVHPDAAIRSPVSGTVSSAGHYVLYCQYNDDFLYIDPDDKPGWQVKIFHIDGVQVAAGMRVEAGVTVIAPRATKLPFESQVDDFTAEPSWPHVHIEVVDPSIPDRPAAGGGC